MHDVDEELREIKREIIESRGLVIKTNNLTNALGADIKSIAKKQHGYERRISWNSATAYVAFVIVVFVALKFAVDARVDAIEAKSDSSKAQLVRLQVFEKEATEREEARQSAEANAAKFYDLARQNKRADLIRAYDSIKGQPLSKTEQQVFADAVDRAKAELASQLYLQGVENSKLSRWAEAASNFEQALGYRDDLPTTSATRLALANSYHKLRRQKDAIPILEKLSESSDRDVEDDALELLALCQTDLEAWNDAKNTWRTLLRKFPDSHFSSEAKLALQRLNMDH